MKKDFVSFLKEAEQFKRAFAKAIDSKSRFSMSLRQYNFIAHEVFSVKACNFLVFGAGYDTDLWHHCSRGKLTVVESDPEWIAKCPYKIVRTTYKGKVDVWLKRIQIPTEIRRRWDFVLVDGPTGYSPNSIGRQEPIACAAKYGRTVFVHDWERQWERKLCDHYLGTPEEIVLFRNNGSERTLAVFRLDGKKRLAGVSSNRIWVRTR